MRVFRETTLDDFSISKITKKAITKNGVNEPTLIAVNLKDQDLEILFEVESTADEHHKVDLKGNEKDSDRGYAVVLRFKNLRDVIGEDKLTRGNLPDVLTDCDVVVHCDCPSFYYQGLQQDDSINNNARYKFQGATGNHQWSLIHSKAGGKTGKALCKHLESVKEWLEDSKNAVEEIADKLKLNETQKRAIRIAEAKIRVIKRNLGNIKKRSLIEMTSKEFIVDYCKDNLDPLLILKRGYTFGMEEEAEQEFFSDGEFHNTRSAFISKVLEKCVENDKDKALIIERLSEFLCGYNTQLRDRKDWIKDKKRNPNISKNSSYTNRRDDLKINDADIRKMTKSLEKLLLKK